MPGIYIFMILSAAMKSPNLHREKDEVDTTERNRDDCSLEERERERDPGSSFFLLRQDQLPFLLRSKEAACP